MIDISFPTKTQTGGKPDTNCHPLLAAGLTLHAQGVDTALAVTSHALLKTWPIAIFYLVHKRRSRRGGGIEHLVLSCRYRLACLQGAACLTPLSGAASGK